MNRSKTLLTCFSVLCLLFLTAMSAHAYKRESAKPIQCAAIAPEYCASYFGCSANDGECYVSKCTVGGVEGNYCGCAGD